MALYLRIRQYTPLTTNVVASVSNITVNGNQAATILGPAGTGEFQYELQIAADPGEQVNVAATRLVAFSTLR
jgi:hypothetical protein